MDSDPGYGIAPPAHRLPAGTSIGAVRLQIADLERSLAFYTRVLGMRVLDRKQSAASLGAERDERVLLELHERRGARPAANGRRLGLYHFAILLPDRASLGRFIVHLRRLGVRAGAADHRVSEALYLDDPDGLGIEVYSDRPRGDWQQRERELVMTTEPLDMVDLVRAGGAAEWAGMPAQTTVGHVHLHVGDIEQADAFYHVALGLDRVVWSYPGALFLSVGGYHHHLGVNTWARSAPPAAEDDARLIEWELIVPSDADLRAAMEHMTSQGYTPDDHAARELAGNVVRDPWGTALRLRTTKEIP